MHLKRVLRALCAGMALTAAVSGCSAWPSTPRQNPPFTIKLNESKVTPKADFDPASADTSVYDHVKVYDASGHAVTLRASDTPILFEAYWCPHCQRTLVMLAQHRAQLGRLPVVVSMGFVPGTTVQQAVQLSQQEEKALHLGGFQVYYATDPSSKQWIPHGYPTLVFQHDGALRMLYGEHTLAVWQQALR